MILEQNFYKNGHIIENKIKKKKIKKKIFKFKKNK